MRKVVANSRQFPFVDILQKVQGPITNVEARQMWQEVVADKEAQEDEIVHDALKIVRKWQR